MKVNSIASIPPGLGIAKSIRSNSADSKYLGFVKRLSEAFPNKEPPKFTRGAMQGEGVCATYNASNDDNYLYSLNAQTCIIATLYNSESKRGAVIHFDHNIRGLIDESLDFALGKVSHQSHAQIQSTLSGGVWFMGGGNIGGAVKTALAHRGVEPSWDHWSFAPCMGHNYGAVLDLETGATQVFDHSVDSVSSLLTPLMSDADRLGGRGEPLPPDLARARAFMKRFIAPAIVESGSGLRFVEGTRPSPVTASDLGRQRISMHDLDSD